MTHGHAILINVLSFLVFGWAWVRFERGPTCVQCSGKLRHRADCPQRREGDR